MATFQSQINILAAGQHRLHSKIEDLTDFSLQVKYDSLATIIKDNDPNDSNKFITIDGLGYQSFDCILTINEKEIHLMDHKGNCEYFTCSNSIPNSLKADKVSFYKLNEGNNTAFYNSNDQTLKLSSVNLTDDNYKIPQIIRLESPWTGIHSEPETEGTP